MPVKSFFCWIQPGKAFSLDLDFSYAWELYSKLISVNIIGQLRGRIGDVHLSHLCMTIHDLCITSHICEVSAVTMQLV